MKKKRINIVLIVIIILISITLMLYKNINYSDYNKNVFISFYNGSKKINEMPIEDNEENLVFDHAICDNGASIEWNEEEWSPLIKNLSKSKTKCSLYFRQSSAIDYIKSLPKTTSGDGLYAVNHDDLEELGQEWNQTEYRYAGENPNNYLKYNNEIWRIIGLVNVKTDSGVEQRIKIVRTDGIANQKDFGKYYWDTDYNNWTTSKLKDMLNGIYYESGIGKCYTGTDESVSEQINCNFTGNGEQPKGLDDIARNMIDKEVIWNIGGSSTEDNVTVKMFYERERSNETFDNYPTVWNNVTDVNNKYNGIGLIYPSDFAYATNGGSIGRETCFAKELFNWSKSDENYNTECVEKDWLKSKSYLWTLTMNSSYSNVAFRVLENGDVNNGYVYYLRDVLPTLYLKLSVKIIDNTQSNLEYGSIENPFKLE